MSEVKINKLNVRKEKEKSIRNQARKCLHDKVRVMDPSNNLSGQLFFDAPTLYINPTEGMHISNLEINGGKVLTVLGSGDFVFDSIYHDASEVVSFDINRNQYYPAALKLKGLQNMSYLEFFNFFSNIYSSDYLRRDVFNKLMRKGDEDRSLFAFFDEVFSQREKDRINFYNTLRDLGLDYKTIEVIGPLLGLDTKMNEVELDMALSRMNIGYPGSVTFRTISGLSGFKKSETYLENEEAYKECQEKVRDVPISFVKAGISRVKNVLEASGKKDKFQAIYLSNIPEYLNSHEFSSALVNQLMPLLHEDGVIGYCIQATDIDTLNMSARELNDIKVNASILEDGGRNIFSLYQLINSVEIYNLLKELYDVSLEEEDTAALANGFGSKDTFVYVRRKMH